MKERAVGEAKKFFINWIKNARKKTPKEKSAMEEEKAWVSMEKFMDEGKLFKLQLTCIQENTLKNGEKSANNLSSMVISSFGKSYTSYRTSNQSFHEGKAHDPSRGSHRTIW